MADPAPKTLKGTVAPGRTLRAGGGPILNDKKEVIGHDDGQDYGPGQEVELPEAQHRDAMKHGFIVNPDTAPVISTGPKIQVTDEPKKA